MAPYKEVSSGILRTADGAFIPRSESNRDYWEYLQWVEAGGVPDKEVVDLSPQVDIERDRRIDAGLTFNGDLYQSRAGDRENISGAAQVAFMAVMTGAQPGDLRWSNPDADFEWILADNSRVALDAPTMVELGKAAAARKGALIFAASNIKQSKPIPTDFTDDRWWEV